MKTEAPHADEAERVLLTAAAAYHAALGQQLVAAYALGSLAHGGFSPLVSDIDLGLIVGDPLLPQDAAMIEEIAQARKASDMPLGDRLSVFWGTPNTLGGHSEGGRFPPLDRLDLLDNGRLLMGVEARHGVPRPSAAELVTAGAEFALDFLAGIRGSRSGPQSKLASMRPAGDDAVDEIRRPEVLVAAGVRRLTKIVLFPVRFMYISVTERVGTNHDAVKWYLERAGVPSCSLVAAALAWRTAEPADSKAATQLLREQILPLYLHYIDNQTARLDSLGEVELARAFREWRARLEA